MDRKKKVHRIPGIAFISPLNVVRRLVISFTSLNAFMILRERTVFKTLKDRKTLKTRKIAKYDNDEIKEILRRKEAEELIDGDINKAINRDIVEVQGKKIKYVRYDYHCQKILCEGILDK